MTAAGLRRFRTRPVRQRAGEWCEMCAKPIAQPHQHVVDIQTRALQCTCRPCYLLFTRQGAARGRHRSVPDRYRRAADFAAGEALWESTGIPVSMAFLFLNSAAESTVAFYPSPAGATESMLPTDSWTQLLVDNPLFADIEPDVEALLINKGPAGFECFLVPIDACYELVGLVRTHWKGFDGGEQAWAQINGFFAGLRERSESSGDAGG